MRRRVKLAVKMAITALLIQTILFSIIYRTGNVSSVNFSSNEENRVAKSDNLKRQAIIVIPGIAGARLYANEIIDNSSCFGEDSKFTGLYKYTFTQGHRLWDPKHSEGYVKAVLAVPEIKGEAYAITCDDDGNSLFDVRAEKDGEGNQYGSQGVYNNLISSLKSQYGDEYDVLFYAYDWRRDMSEVASELELLINDSKYEKVTLVCHSLGGLIGCTY